MKRRSKFNLFIIYPVLLLVLSGCLPGIVQGSPVQFIQPSPTLNPVFVGEKGLAALSASVGLNDSISATGTFNALPEPTKTGTPEQTIPTATPIPEETELPAQPTPAPSATPTAGPTATPETLPTLVIYDDNLNSN